MRSWRWVSCAEIRRNDKQDNGDKMFEVLSYEHPYIFVRCRRTWETYRFLCEMTECSNMEEHSSTKAKPVARR